LDLTRVTNSCDLPGFIGKVAAPRACAAIRLFPLQLGQGEELWLQQKVMMTLNLSLVTRGPHEWLDLSHRTNCRHHGDSVISGSALSARTEMPISETPESMVTPGFGLTWGPAIAGAIAASALAFVLDSFGVAIGLALSSFSPTWRDTSFALVLLSGLYLVLAALASYGLGGYIAGRMRHRHDLGELPEFEDGMQGLLVWSIATVLAGLIATVTLTLLPRTPGSAAVAPNATSSVPGENLIAFELDRLFRGSERRTGGDLSYDRAEAARILLTTSSHSGMDPADRAYLARLIAADTGTSAPDAERRVDEVAARVKQDIRRARGSAVILAFMAGAAALLGAIAAWAAAITAGRYRDGREPIPYLLDWSIESRSRATPQSIPRQ
jgi:hypothetical protein